MNLPFELPTRFTPSGKRFEGGQGSVYVCTDTFLERQVAIKVIEESSGTGHILKELAAIQRIKSRHVVQIYDIISSKYGNALGIVQEFVPGAHVSGSFNAGMAVDEFIRILYQIACGISDVH